MPLTVEPEVFVKEYFECWDDPQRSTDVLYEYIRPFLDNWVCMLTNPDAPKDISYISLCQRLESVGDPIEKLQAWRDRLLCTTSIYDELTLLFFTRLRGLNYYPKKASAKMVEYVVAKDFRDRLKDLIITQARYPLDLPSGELTFGAQVEDEHADYFLLKNLGLNDWEVYMLALIQRGLSAPEISELTHIPRRTYSREERKLWHRLRTKWHGA